MKLFFTFFLTALTSLSAICQDSLVTINEITFNSDFEKRAFDEFFTKKTQQFLPLFLAANATMDETKANGIQSRIDQIVGEIKMTGVEKKKADKKIKAIYEKVHDPLLKKYELENRFHEIFSSGNYNCVTATALYSLIFEQLDIPYEIKEEPTHVYLLSYPNKENILVETTTPMFGYINFNGEFKERYVSNLKKQKVIGTDESERKTTDELFNQYYFKNEKISLRELTGIHYMNDALFLKDHGKWKEGFYQLEKAYLFYPSQRCKYLAMAFAAEVVAKEKLSPKEKSVFIGKLSRYSDEGITPDMIKGEFINLTQDLLFRENNKTLHQECYQILTSKIHDKELLKEIDFVYYSENGRAYYNLGNYAKAKPFYEKALSLQPNNIDLGGIFINLIGQSIRTQQDEKVLLDSLNAYKEKFPSLTQFNNFNSLLANAVTVNYGEAYEKGDLTLAKKHKDYLDELLKNNPNVNLNYNVVGKAFSSVCTYYFRKGQKAKAREVLQEGLKISPDNYQLRTRLQMIR